MIKVYKFCFYDFFVGNNFDFDNYLFLLDVMYSKYLLGVFIKKYIFFKCIFVWRFFIYIMIDFVFYNCNFFFSIYFIDKIFIGY